MVRIMCVEPVEKSKEKPSLSAWFFYACSSEKQTAAERQSVARKSPAGKRERVRDRGTKPLAEAKESPEVERRGWYSPMPREEKQASSCQTRITTKPTANDAASRR